MKLFLFSFLALSGLLPGNRPVQAQPYRFFPNVNPGIQRSIIMPESDFGYGYERTSYPVRRGGDYYGRPPRETTVINGDNNCFKCRFGGYRGQDGYRRGNP
ncbi:MAG: hypothetical protein ACK5CA_11085 [Cyanobacteriota bacterium]|jgi:hypothetical protein